MAARPDRPDLDLGINTGMGYDLALLAEQVAEGYRGMDEPSITELFS